MRETFPSVSVRAASERRAALSRRTIEDRPTISHTFKMLNAARSAVGESTSKISRRCLQADHFARRGDFGRV